MDGVFFAGRQTILGVGFDFINYRAVFEAVNQWRKCGERKYICVANPHSVLLCHRNKRMMSAAAGAAMTLPDGIGVILAANLLRYKNIGRVTGPALMLKLVNWGRWYGFRHYFYGGLEGVADKLADRLSQNYPGLQIAGTYSPPFGNLSQQADAEIVAEINRARPDILWVGLGAPKQEIWMAGHLGRINAAVMIGIGAAFDFHSGSVRWAPKWIRDIGLEWAYRLTQEPKRMWRRNLDSPVFLTKVLGQLIKTKTQSAKYQIRTNI